MKRIIAPRAFTIPLAVIGMLTAAGLLVGADNRPARVTQVVHDVRLLISRTAPRPATLNDDVREGSAVRTGADSRAELTFTDRSLTRLGSNTLFTVGSDSHSQELSGGAALIAVPPEVGTVRIRTPGVTAGISGGITMMEYHDKSSTKIIVLEGQAIIRLASSGATLTLLPGQLITIPPGAKSFGRVYNIDLKKLADGSLLIRFARLPSWFWALLNAQIAQQKTAAPPGGFVDTGFDAIDQRFAADQPTPEPVRHRSPPPERR